MLHSLARLATRQLITKGVILVQCLRAKEVIYRSLSPYKGPMFCPDCNSVLDVVERSTKHGRWVEYVHPIEPRLLGSESMPWEFEE